jgi:hypothetical protein
MTVISELPLSALGWPGLPRDARLNPTPILLTSTMQFTVDEVYVVIPPDGKRYYYSADPSTQTWEFYGSVD